MMRRLLPLILLFPLWAGAAEYWVDLAGTGTGAADGSDVSNLCAGTGDADCTPSAGDTVNLCNASTTQFVPGVDGSEGSEITYNWAPTGCTAASIETSGSTSGLNLGARVFLVMNDATLTQTGTARCVNIPGADDITFNRGRIGPCAQTSTGAEGAIVFSPTVASERVVFNETYITNPTGNCIALVNATGSIDYADLEFNDLEIENCGNAAGEHGIRLKTAAAAAATITRPIIAGGTITGTYDYAIDLVGTDTTRTDKIIDPVVDDVDVSGSGLVGPATGSGGGAIRLQNALRPIVRNNDLSDNLGNGGGLVALYSQNGLVENNDCSRMISASNQIDGGGIDMDHGNDDFRITRNRCRGNLGNSTAVNSGYGLMVLDSTNIVAYANDFRGNKIGISYNPQNSGGAGQDNEFTNNILCQNTRDGVHINSDSTAENAEFYNNLICLNGRYGFSVGDADSNMIADYNAYWQNATADYNNQDAGANDITSDPKLVGGPNPTTPEGFKLQTDSPLIRAGTCYLTTGCVHYDYEGKRARVPPDIGAFQRNDP